MGLRFGPFRAPRQQCAVRSPDTYSEHLEPRVLLSGQVLSEDFEGALDPRISVATVGDFNSPPGVKALADFGSTKAFGFGLSTRLVNAFDDYVTTLRITLDEPAFITSVAFQEKELFDNFGSQGRILIDNVQVTDSFAFGRQPVNDGQPDTAARALTLPINRSGRVVDVQVWDITSASELYIDDLLINTGPVPVGALDPGFGGGDGLVVADPAGDDVETVDVVSLPGDKTLALAFTVPAAGDRDIELIQFNSDGSFDTSFGDGDGVALLAMPGSNETAAAVLVQPGGSILVAGSSVSGDGGDADFVAARFDSTGVLDSSFGVGGIKVIDFAPDALAARSFDFATDLVTEPGTGKIVAVGRSDAAGRGNDDIALVRLNPDGSIDGSFGDNGRVLRDLAAQSDVANAIAVQSDGGIVIAGSTGTADAGTFVVQRYDSDGLPDATFGINGMAAADFGAGLDEASEIVIQADGKLLAAGVANSGAVGDPTLNADFALVRFDSDGNPDSSFDVDGQVTIDFGGLDAVSQVAIHAGGKIVASGRQIASLGDTDVGREDVVVARLNPDGSLDTGFAQGGKTTLNVTANENTASASSTFTRSAPNLASGSEAALDTDFERFLRDSQGLVAIVRGGRVLVIATEGANVRLAVLVGDSGAPTVAVAFVPAVSDAGLAEIRFRIRYVDDLGINLDLLGSDDVRVSSTNGFNALAEFVGFVDDVSTALVRTVEYRVTPARIGAFDDRDNGVYLLSVEAGSVADVINNFVQPAAIPGAEFTVGIPAGDLPNLVVGALVIKLKNPSVVGGSRAPGASVSVANESEFAASGAITIRVVASHDESVDGSDTDVVVLPNQKVNLKPNKSKAFKLKLGHFPNTVDGDFFLLAQVDRDNAIAEISESDNVGATGARITIARPFVDVLAPTGSFAVPVPELRPLAKMNVSVLLQNLGNVPLKQATDVRMFASPDTSLDSGDHDLAVAPLKLGLQPGASRAAKLKLTLSSSLSLPVGDYYLIIVLDDLDVLAEKDETNNVIISGGTATFVSP